MRVYLPLLTPDGGYSNLPFPLIRWSEIGLGLRAQGRSGGVPPYVAKS